MVAPRRPKKGQRTVADHPHLVAQWDQKGNGNYKPEDVLEGSTYVASWMCDVCQQVWQALVYTRAGKLQCGCPFCDGKQVQQSESLAEKFKDIAAEWDYEANAGLKAECGSPLLPSNCPPCSHKKVWWRHTVGGVEHKWDQAVHARTSHGQGGRGCPYCFVRGGPRWKENLADAFPSVAAMWHPDLNGGLRPKGFTPGSHVVIAWLCPEITCSLGHPHVWEAPIYDVVKAHKKGQTGCPLCATTGTSVCVCNSLEGKYPQLAAEFHWTKNTVVDRKTGVVTVLRPSQVPPHSKTKSVWWCCCVCRSDYQCSPATRTKRLGTISCPQCKVNKKGSSKITTVP